MNQEKIGKFIRELRIEKQMTQQELAGVLGVTDSAISKWETGRGEPDITFLIPLSKELNITVLELLNGEKGIDESCALINLIKEKDEKTRIWKYLFMITTNILLSDLLNKFGSNIDNYHKELRLIKEASITNVEVILSKGTKKLIYDTDKQKKYLIDIEKISYYKNGVECVIDTTFPSNDLDCSANLVTVTKSDIDEGYVISEGKYYNELSECIVILSI